MHRTYWRKGCRPVIEHKCKYSKLALISAISESGKMIYQVRQGTFNGKAIVYFLKRLVKYTRRKIILIWDGAAVHRCQDVKDFLETQAGKKLWLVRLPAYCPELNADEQVWHYLKDVMLKNQCAKNIKELRESAENKMQQIAQNPKLIKRFFHHPEVGFY